MKIMIKKILPALGILFLLNACTDLDTEVKSEYTEENFPITQADMEAVCGPAYSRFKACYGRSFWLMTGATTDESVMVTNDNNWYDKGYYGEFVLHTWTYDNSMTLASFEDLFTCISSCNQIMAILEKAPESEYKTQAMAEMKTMRALYYFWAMDNFGRLPIIEKFGDSAPQADRDKVAEFIKKELLEAIPLLTTKSDATTYGKPTKYMAQALLAKLYLNWGVYTATDITKYEPTDSNKGSNPHLDDLVTICDEIIKSEKFELGNDWLSKFAPNNGPQIKDFIFAFPYKWDLSDGNLHMRFWGHKFFEFTLGMKKKPSGPLRAAPEFVDKYNLEGDVRNKIWRGGPQYHETSTSSEPYIVKISKKTLDRYYTGEDKDAIVDWHFELTKDLIIRGNTPQEIEENTRKLDLGGDELGLAMGYRNVKFYPNTNSTNHDQDNDIPIFRYADVLLMKAEAILRGATPTLGDTPESLVNQIRACAQAPAASSVTLDELLDERAREFADEYWRRNDLIRFGKFEEDWGLKKASLGTSNNEKYRRIFSIPLKMMQLNPDWEQNPGYTK